MAVAELIVQGAVPYVLLVSCFNQFKFERRQSCRTSEEPVQHDSGSAWYTRIRGRYAGLFKHLHAKVDASLANGFVGCVSPPSHRERVAAAAVVVVVVVVLVFVVVA